MLYHPVSIAFLKWLTDTANPDESFYSTLIRVEVDEESGEMTQNDA
jgi:hypothetical protein